MAKRKENCQLLLLGNHPCEDECTLIFYPPHLILTFAHNSQGGGKRTTAPLHQGGGKRTTTPSTRGGGKRTTTPLHVYALDCICMNCAGTVEPIQLENKMPTFEQSFVHWCCYNSSSSTSTVDWNYLITELPTKDETVKTTWSPKNSVHSSLRSHPLRV